MAYADFRRGLAALAAGALAADLMRVMPFFAGSGLASDLLWDLVSDLDFDSTGFGSGLVLAFSSEAPPPCTLLRRASMRLMTLPERGAGSSRGMGALLTLASTISRSAASYSSLNFSGANLASLRLMSSLARESWSSSTLTFLMSEK